MAKAHDKKKSRIRKGVRWSANTWGTKDVNYHVINAGEVKI